MRRDGDIEELGAGTALVLVRVTGDGAMRLAHH